MAPHALGDRCRAAQTTSPPQAAAGAQHREFPRAGPSAGEAGGSWLQLPGWQSEKCRRQGQLWQDKDV